MAVVGFSAIDASPSDPIGPARILMSAPVLRCIGMLEPRDHSARHVLQ